MKCGIVDLGSNTIRLTVYKYEKNSFEILFSNKDMAGLAGYVENGILAKKGVEKAIYVLEDYKNIMNSLGIKNMFVFATASLRNIKNTDEAVKHIFEKTGLNVEVIDGKEEAILSFTGAKYNINEKNGLLIDIGGGSTEIVLYKNSEIISAESVPIGSLSLYKEYVSSIIPNKSEKRMIKQHIKDYLINTNVYVDEDINIICGVGGTLRAALKLNNELMNFSNNNNIIHSQDLKYILELLERNDKVSLLTILKIIPDRIHTITTGVYLLSTIVKHFEIEKIIVSKYGVREGYLINKILNK